ncbi:glycosyltransferase family 4 protein [Ruminococcus sp. HUN007]|uniref:glycosyltransferase family 4 protein n=1 Tax=Ruminococcus sp. HUN007 TaxID=1514668 RepID=UPI0005D2BC3A|nr:glycosyltransferase family 4 protein [Ruminococcus sp. HUN007]
MKIYQLVASLNFGDAIGNDVIAKKHVIEDMGIETEIYAAHVAPKITEPGAYVIDKMPKVNEDDIVIYHMGNGSPMNHMVTELNCRRIMFYHNITPYEFFGIDNVNSVENCRRGIEDMHTHMKGKFDAYICASQFSKDDMVKMGYKEDLIDVIPIIVPFEDYSQTPDEAMMRKLSDGVTNILFVGRIAPNKKHEDIIRAFAYYKKNVNENSRLILVGSHDPNGMYYNDIVSYVEKLGVEDVVFPGHISFAEILAIYSKADVFLCMSEHEGFCVPLVEAMTFGVPVIAYDACAVPETLGGSGVVVDDKDPVFLSKVINEVVNNQEMRKTIIEAQKKRLEDFRYDKLKDEFQRFLKDFMAKYPPLNNDDSKKKL